MKIIIFFLLTLILLIPSVFAINLQDINDALLINYKPNGSINSDFVGIAYPETTSGSPFYSTTSKKIGLASTYFTSDRLTYNITEKPEFDTIINQSIYLIINGTFSSRSHIFGSKNEAETNNNTLQLYYRQDTNTIICQISLDSGEGFISATANPSGTFLVDDTDWEGIGCELNCTGTTATLYFVANDTYLDEDSQTVVGCGRPKENITLGMSDDGQNPLLDNGIDNVLYINRTIGTEGFALLYNNGDFEELPLDTTPPIVNTTLNKSVIYYRDTINISANITDENELSSCQIIINQTGEKTIWNTTLSGTSAQCSNKTEIIVGVGNVINFTMMVEDISGNWKMNDTIVTIMDNIPPVINISLNKTPIEQNDIINISGNLSDNIGLDFCQIFTNQSTSIEFYNFSLSGLYDFCSQNFTILVASGNIINFTIIVNDTSNNKNQSSIKILIGDVTAPEIIATSIQDRTSYTTTQKINITCNITEISDITNMKVTINKSDVHTNYSMSLLEIVSGTYIYQYADTFGIGTYNIPFFYADDSSGNRVQENTTLNFTVVTPSGNGGTPTPSGGGGLFTPTCPEGFALVKGDCTNLTLFNITFKVIGLTNIDQFVLYGGNQEWRYTIRTNKIVKNASFETPQMNTEINLIGSNVLVIKKLNMVGRIFQRIDMGNLVIVDTTNQVVRVSMALRLINMINPIFWIIIAIPTTFIIFRKKIIKFFKK